MNQKLTERINKIIPRIQSKEFLNNKVSAGEIAFYVLDYAPEYELDMRNQINFITNQVAKKHSHIKIAHVNLFKLIVDYLKNRGLLERALKLQKEKGGSSTIQSPFWTAE